MSLPFTLILTLSEDNPETLAEMRYAVFCQTRVANRVAARWESSKGLVFYRLEARRS